MGKGQMMQELSCAERRLKGALAHPAGTNVLESHQSSVRPRAEPGGGGALSRPRAAHRPPRTALFGLSPSAQPLSGLTGDKWALGMVKALEPASSGQSPY